MSIDELRSSYNLLLCNNYYNLSQLYNKQLLSEWFIKHSLWSKFDWFLLFSAYFFVNDKQKWKIIGSK